MRFLDLFDYQVTNPYIGTSINKAKTKQPLYGYKQAALYYDPATEHVFFSGIKGKPYGVLAAAKCANGYNHTGKKGRQPAIHKECSCGFYSYNSFTKAQNHQHNQQHTYAYNPIIKTAISGYYIEYDKGYRAEKQRVMSISVSYCYFHHSFTDVKAAVGFIILYRDEIQACCQKCLNSFGKGNKWENILTFDELSEKMTYPENYGFPKVTVESQFADVTGVTRFQLEHRGKTEEEVSNQLTLGAWLRKAWGSPKDVAGGV